ncbi:uncharacterized protein GLRG_06733 [Colletotrichum graminicola M1.001]|uniref:Uncharacterized protein n=1 Tax=Colletotrichum graminicola (strain M1.001 / M2 / FGSC 10212) TaxID=645133 RepID=E3QLM0_COLGM|nr:uncharacterized protein GLRG_06733 [Colletotrichum graminicola M1.001]EFQ31758.1 hypothetical protein GLRG_06733 [Colletotrichum graminicola M1.001]
MSRFMLPVVFFGTFGYVLMSWFPTEFGRFVGGGGVERTITRSHLESLHTPGRVDNGGSRRLRLFMPADGPSVNLCKTIMSAVALGYPTPTLLNWNGEFNRPDWHFAGSHIAKLESLLAAIDDLYERDDSDVNENDLLLLVDAYDVWFQLPPSVLIERFHRLNRKADARARKQWEDLGLKPDFPVAPPAQEIVVTTAKDCQPTWESGSDPRYEYWPDSPLPPDFYGNETDQVLPYVFDSARRYSKMRPRCVNSGMVMGTVGSLRGALRKCKGKADAAAAAGRQLWSDQALLAEVIGDQEVWRHWVRGLAAAWNGIVSPERPGRLPREVRRIADAALAGEAFEFGIGLDYESCPAPLSGHTWGDLPLYTDFFFGTPPVGIHHNAYVFGLKAWRLEHWWNLTWFYPHLRGLVTEALASNRKLTPLARFPLGADGGSEMVYWASGEGPDEASVKVFDGSKERTGYSSVGWDGVCQKGDRKWYDVVFADGKGPLAA